MRRIITISMLVLAGCSASMQPEVPGELPELVSMASLPPFRTATFHQRLRLNFTIHVKTDGSVDNVRLMGTSGDPSWDSLAVQSVHRWRFTAARYQGQPTAVWIRQEVTVIFQQPTRLPLAEIVLNTSGVADSLYALLMRGAPFDSLARECSVSESRNRGGALGMVDLSLYPQRVREELSKLGEGDITRPVRIGDTYVIFKMLRDVVVD